MRGGLVAKRLSLFSNVYRIPFIGNNFKWLLLLYQKQPFAYIFFKVRFLKDFAIFTGKQLLLEFLFNKVVDLKVCNFVKKGLQHRCFPFHRIPPVAASVWQMFLIDLQGYFSLELPFIAKKLSLGMFLSLADFSAIPIQKALLKIKTIFLRCPF